MNVRFRYTSRPKHDKSSKREKRPQGAFASSAQWSAQRIRLNVMKRPAAIALLCTTLVGASVCASVGVSMVGAMLGLGASHQINGISARTFTESQPNVEEAVVAALERMGMRIVARESDEALSTIRASANDREIDLQIEPITPLSTRVSATARRTNGFFNDGATSAEVVAQTEKALALLRQAAAPAIAVAPPANPTRAEPSGFAPPAPAAKTNGRPVSKASHDESSIVRWEFR